jgi:uncharacterized membrane protein YgcG
MRGAGLAQLGALPLTIVATLAVAAILLGLRVFVMQRVQSKRAREQRQESERLRSLIAAYRAMAGSFTPAAPEQGGQIEEALADIVLFGTLEQVEMAAACARGLRLGQPVDFAPLVASLRADLRAQLGLEPLPADLDLPTAGPGRSARGGRGEGEGGGRGEGRGGGGAGGGAGGGGGMAAGGVGVAVIGGSHASAASDSGA